MKLIKTIDEQGVMYSLSGDNLPENYVLSDKNCQAIERGYDLDELAKADADLRYNQPGEEDLWLTRVTGIEYGFNLALEILGDKKFSSGQLLNAMDLVWQWMNGEDYGCKTLTEVQDKYIQSLQQNEWEVEIVEEEPLVAKARQIHGEYVASKLIESAVFPKPLFDADGCLILKRK